MAQASQTSRTVLYAMPGMDAVTVRRDVPYRVTDTETFGLDLYRPPGHPPDAGLPAVLFVTGFADPGAVRMLGARFKEMGSFESWARLVAASGIVGITYENQEPRDADDVLRYVRQNASSLGIDRERLGIWACSGHGPNALWVMMEHGRNGLACAVLVYPYTLDIDGTTRVAEASHRFRFVTPAAGNSVQDLPVDLPIFVARAGRDQMPGLNDALDAFIGAALAHNLPLTLANHASGPHAFDVVDDSRTTIETIKQILTFLQFHLLK